MKKIPSGIAGAAVAAGLLFSVFSSLADSPPPPPAVFGATLTFSNGDTLFLEADSRFPAIGMAPGESVTIAVQLPASFANAPGSIQALDGGTVTADDVVIAADSTAAVGFQVGTAPGSYRLLLGALGKSATLQFQVTPQ